MRRGELQSIPGVPPIVPVPHDAPWPPFEVMDEPPTDHPQVQSGVTHVSGPGEYRLLALGDMLPISLVVPVLDAVNTAIEKQGYEAFFKDATGMGVMWIRKRTT